MPDQDLCRNPLCGCTPSPPVCRDCGGPTRQAFPRTTAYLSCRRCGHVHPNPQASR